jgi:hypothetical protein
MDPVRRTLDLHLFPTWNTVVVERVNGTKWSTTETERDGWNDGVDGVHAGVAVR